MLTLQGGLVLVGAVVLVAAKRVFGPVELFVCGMAAAVAVVGAVAQVRLARLRLGIARTVSPVRVHAGEPSTVSLVVANQGSRATRVLRLLDPVTGTAGADLLLAPVPAGERTTASYRLPTHRRGIVEVGPLTVVIQDPFGLARRRQVAAPRLELTVLPRIDLVAAVPRTGGHDPHAGTVRSPALGRSGDDFHALRPYERGDDLRRIHWPSSARRDELVVRQDEVPWQGRVTIVVDLRAGEAGAEAFEAVVSAAASVVAASWRRRDLLRLVTSDGFDSGFAEGTAHVEAIVERLAVVQASPARDLAEVVASATGPGRGSGAVVVLTTSTAPAVLPDVRRRRSGAVTVVRLWPGTAAGRAPEADPGVDREVVVATIDGFAATWNQAMAVPHRRGAPAGAR